jgi:hypothetical protein
MTRPPGLATTTMTPTPSVCTVVPNLDFQQKKKFVLYTYDSPRARLGNNPICVFLPFFVTLGEYITRAHISGARRRTGTLQI